MLRALFQILCRSQYILNYLSHNIVHTVCVQLYTLRWQQYCHYCERNGGINKIMYYTKRNTICPSDIDIYIRLFVKLPTLHRITNRRHRLLHIKNVILPQHIAHNIHTIYVKCYASVCHIRITIAGSLKIVRGHS